jgi:hypothetical protein
LNESEFELCRSSFRTKWKSLSMLYRREMERSMPDEVSRIIQSVRSSRPPTYSAAQTSNHGVCQNLHPQGYLVKKYNLNLIGKAKPVMYIDDFFEVLSCLWRSDKMYFATEQQRTQLWFFEHIAGYSGSRPGSLVDASRGPDFEPVNEFDNGASEPCLPTYRDCTLTLLPNPQAGHRGIWVLEIQMNRTKGGLGLVRPYDPPCRYLQW